ncbi:MAG: efflux RND transporter periplasmic adaptor subunit [Alistipes sp.]|nr:efflux RND transporter periplasmic adaptor subunit [Alistipes sp.]
MRSFFIILSLLYVACGGVESTPERKPKPVKSIVTKRVEYLTREYAALSTADDAVTLAFKVAGRVVDAPVAKGMSVKRGALLAQLDKRDVELQVEATLSAYREARSRLERAERLLEYNAISAQEVEGLRNALTQSLSAYRNALDMVSETRIVAPFDGVIERVYVDTYERVSSGQPIVRIVRPRSTTVGFTAPEYLLSYLSLPTTRYSVTFDAYKDTSFSAAIKSYARTSSDALGFPVSLRLVDVDTTRYNISPGMTCVAAVVIVENDSEAVSVPLTAIYAPVGGDDYVWVVDNDNIVAKRRVVLGELTGEDSVIVVHGLKSGERIVSAGVYHLTNGERVRLL